MAWLSFVIALVGGGGESVPIGANAQLNKQMGQPVWAGAVVYATGLLGLLLLMALAREPLPGIGAVREVRWWAWAGGVVSIASTMAGLTLAQKLGSGVFTGLSLTASLIASVLLDHLGVLGFKQHPASPARLAGCGLMVVGVWVVTRF